MVLDKQTHQTDGKRKMSYVDYGFGSDEYKFAGCHRFQISRFNPDQPDSGNPIPIKDEARIKFSVQGFTCNPQTGKLSTGRILPWFHSVYVRLLFADGMREVLRR